MTILNSAEIMSLIPHRYPFLLIDKVVELKANDSIIAVKNVTVNEPQFTGHFPSKPIMPGVLIIEAMAQASAILVARSLEPKEGREVYFMSIDSAKFRKVVEPGDTVYIHAKIEQSRAHVWKFSAKAMVDGAVVSESNFTAMVK